MAGQPEKIAVVGAGAWGTALADHLARGGRRVSLWALEPEVARAINERRENPLYLAGHSLTEGICATSDLTEALGDSETVVLVCPSQKVREVAGRARGFLGPGILIVCASKGIENDTRMTMSEVLAEVLDRPGKENLVCLSGPSFAEEVARRMPTVVVAASPHPQAARRVQTVFASEVFRVYGSDDIVGVELGGAIKNVIAMAAGTTDGLGFGTNTRAALITRGLAEMARLGVAKGANPLTFAGLAGMGDLVLTCTGELSRNRRVGLRIGRGESIERILSETRTVAEGIRTAKSTYNLARRLGVEMPIIEEIYRVLYEGKEPRQAVRDLMTRDLKHELHSLIPGLTAWR